MLHIDIILIKSQEHRHILSNCLSIVRDTLQQIITIGIINFVRPILDAGTSRIVPLKLHSPSAFAICRRGHKGIGSGIRWRLYWNVKCKGGGLLRIWEARWAFVRGMRKGMPKGFSPFGNRSTLPVSA